MSPERIGALASLCQIVAKKHPGEFMISGIGDWETELIELVNNDRRLPNYEDVDQTVVDFLINHYGSDYQGTENV